MTVCPELFVIIIRMRPLGSGAGSDFAEVAILCGPLLFGYRDPLEQPLSDLALTSLLL